MVVPNTPETNHLIGKPELDLMKSSSVLINIGRGNSLDENALIESLNAGKLSGAVLDVFKTEPLPSDSELWNT